MRIVFSVLSAVTLLAPAKPQTTVLRAQRMIDVRASQILSPTSIVVSNVYISAVNPLSIPAGAAIVDLGNVTLLPGFIDTHVHLLLSDAVQYRADIVGRDGNGSSAAFLN